MHDYVSLDGEIIPASSAPVPAISPASFYGKGVFTTLALFDGKPFLRDKHLRRLFENAVSIGVDLSELSGEALRESLDELLERNDVAEGRARITVFDLSNNGIWDVQSERKTSQLITTANKRHVSHSLRVGVSHFPINSHSPLAGVKSCNYLEHLLAYYEAKAHGFDEAIRLNQRGEITSACMANVFWLRSGRLYTPSLATGCLPGTTREFVMENLECNEVEAEPEELNAAEAIFLTSAGIGIARAHEFDGRAFENVTHPILELWPAT